MLTPDELRRYIGMVLGGRYRLNALIGQGGMGAVFRGTDPRLTRDVAVKVISVNEGAERARHRSRFEREAKLAAGIRHPNVVVVHDFGTHSDAQAGVELDYIVMELLPGEDLAKWLPRLSRTDLSLSISILVQAARGLAAGHRAGITHRDVKPRNFVVSSADAPGAVDVKVVDFGIAKSHASDDPTDNTLPGFVGSERYASPEHVRGGSRPSPAWDVFGLGVVAYEVLAGSYPFTDDERARLVEKVPMRIRPLRTINPTIPAAVEAVVLRCLEPDPAGRYAHAGDVAAALERAWAESATERVPERVLRDTDRTFEVVDRTELDGTVLHVDPVPVVVAAHAGAARLGSADAQPLDGASPANVISASIESGGGAAIGPNGAAAGAQDPAPPDDRRQNPVQPRPERWRPGKRAWAAAAGVVGLLAFAVFGGPGAAVELGRAAKAYFASPGAIRLDRPISGVLEKGDSSTSAGKNYDVFAYHGAKGQPLSFEAGPAEFEPVLEWTHLEDGEWKILESSSGKHAQLHVTLKDTSEYRLRVRASREGDRGKYVVKPGSGSPVISPGKILPSQITAGDRRLLGGVWSERWMLSARPGSQVTVTVHPRSFRANVQWWQADVGDPEMVERAMSDSPGQDASLTVTIPESGEYYLQVQNRDKYNAGWYSITATIAARELRPGIPVTSWITHADSDAAGGLVSEQWIYRGTPGEPVMIWLQSRGRMVLEWWHLVGTQWTELKAVATNGAPTAMLVRPTATGEYYLRVRGASPAETGAYTIEPIAQPIIGTIAGNQSVSGTLDASDSLGDGTYAELWSLSGSPGEQVSITMISGGLYPALSFGCWTVDGVWQKIHDDSPASPGYARVDAAVGGTGECAIRAASAAPWGGTGPYILLAGMQETGFAPKM